MAVIGISEFTFGYAFLYEQTQTNWEDLTAAPVLPSLQKEAEQGWDAYLPLTGVDYYYQFKLSDYLFNWNAKYIREGIYNNAYYRITLHRRNNNRQHNRLRQHCIQNPQTFYVAPEFNNVEAFNNSFLSRQITDNCRIIPLSLCDDIDDGEQHYISFQQNQPGWRQHSEPKIREKSFTGKDLRPLYMESHNSWEPVNRDFAERLFEKTRAIARRIIAEEEPERVAAAMPLLDIAPQQATERDYLVRTSEILSAFLGLTLVLVGARR
jgi:hypothetical protein